jgi:hypothetical protein
MTFKDIFSIVRATYVIDAYKWDLVLASLLFFAVAFLFHFISLEVISTSDLPLQPPLLNFITWILAYLLLRNVIFNTLRTRRRYVLDLKKWPAGWIWNGRVSCGPKKESLIITEASPGCLLRTRVWKNFEMSVTTSFPRFKTATDSINPSKIGLVFRAENLTNYYMFQVEYIQEEKSFKVNPHILVNGNWEHWSGDLTPIGNLNLDESSLKNGFEIILHVNGNVAYTKINNKSVIKWVLPSHSRPNNVVRQEKDDEKRRGNHDLLPDDGIPKLWFRDKPGMVGFRNFGHEQALVKKMTINKI